MGEGGRERDHRFEDDSPFELRIEPRARHIGAFAVERLLPIAARRSVGPFVFLDHMGPVALGAGQAADVPPHPHIGLATVTYLFQGAVLHRDSLGSEQEITPGAINWMTAGRGIAHSERTPERERVAGPRLHGLQLWVALPTEHEEMAPEFHHHPAATLPELSVDGVGVRLLAGSAFGQVAPVRTLSPLFYLEARLPAGAVLPLPAEHPERGVYLVDGELANEADDQRLALGRLLVLRPGAAPRLRATRPSLVMLLGGASLGPRHMLWNFVSSSRERLQRAAEDWKARRFPLIPGDERDYVPMPG